LIDVITLKGQQQGPCFVCGESNQV